MSSRFCVQISSLHWSHCRVWIFSLCAFPPTYPRSGLVVFKLAVGVAVSCGLSVLVLWWTVQLYRVYPTSHSWQLGCSPAPPGPRVGYCTSDPWFPCFFSHPCLFSAVCIHGATSLFFYYFYYFPPYAPLYNTFVMFAAMLVLYSAIQLYTVLVYRIWITHNFWVRNIVQYSQPHTFFFRHSQSNTIVQMV